MNGVELRHLRAFLAVAEELNFTRAADRLHLAQQALSRQIQQLEERIGVQLLVRTTRKVELTPAGTALLEHAREVIAAADRAVAAARAAGEAAQILTVGIVVPADHAGLKPVLDAFKARRPDVEVRARFGEVTDPDGGVREGAADIALAVGAFDQTGLAKLTLWSDPRGVAIAADHPLAAKDALTVDEFVSLPTFDFPVPDPVFRDFWMATGHRAGRPPRIAAAFTSLDGLLEAVRLGLGVNLVREVVVDALGPAAGVVFRPVTGLEQAEVALVWAEGDSRPVVAEFVEAARAVTQRNPVRE